MENIRETLYDSQLKEIGFYRDKAIESKNDPGWFHYSCLSEKGEGYYRFYVDRNLFVITVWDMTLKEDLTHDFNQTDYISVACYDAVEGKVLKPYEVTLTPCILGHVGREETFRVQISRNKPHRGAGIMILPAYYKDYLQSSYPEEYENPLEAFAGIDGITDFPEFRLLLRQISNCRSQGISARLFFASKVAECVSLIVERSRSQRSQGSVHQISSQDRKNLQLLVSYIEDNLNDRLLLEHLARIARMGKTKLKYTFKQVYQSTISDFILARRISRAELLLSCSDLNINHVSQAVGYKCAGKFSEVFRKNTGLLPNEYRKLAVSKDFQPVDHSLEKCVGC